MLDIRFIRENPELVRDGLRKKRVEFPLDELLAIEEERRRMLHEGEVLKAERNSVSEEIAKAKRAGQDAAERIAAMRAVGDKIAAIDESVRGVDAKLDDLLLRIPNMPHASVPEGIGAEDNVPVRSGGPAIAFDFPARAHWEVGEALGILDLARAAKISGSGFSLLRGAGAKLSRALINWMLDIHTTENGYEEVAPPHLVLRSTMTGTGQLPKMEEDMYRTDLDDLFLIPTAEVPVTNIYRDEILEPDDLPRKFVAYTPCYRREAGSAGKETRGMTRVHQFDKVELVKLVRPETSYDELESLLGNATSLLDRLELPYRVITLCTGDLSFGAAKCYDIEVMSPASGKWLEVSSCSNFEDFQARRMNLRFRPGAKEKPRFVHTLNGSALALPRVIIGIIENCQTKDGKVRIPAVLRPYMGGLELIG
ncbi:MAG: serine--tRNA ligase [bacterium]